MKKEQLIKLYEESWHQIYPNKKRKNAMNKKSNRHLYFKLLDNLLKKGYDKKTYAMSHISYDLELKKQPNYYKVDDAILINYFPHDKVFSLEERRGDNKIIDYGKLNFEQTVEEIDRIISFWNKKVK